MGSFEKTISQIRNILRSAAIAGVDSIDHCITFIIMKYMTKSTCEILNIPIKFSYENLMDMIESDSVSNDDVYKLIYSKTNESIMHIIHGTFRFTNIKFKLESIDDIIKIIKLVDTLDLDKLEFSKDIIGTIYELHLKTGSTGGGMRDLGQYFTPRKVIQYMIELCNPTMIGDKIEKIIDPTCGTGGFLTMSIKYLNDKYPNIDWEKNHGKLIGFDKDDKVVNITKINILIESKKFLDTIVCRDTLNKDMKLTELQSELMADVLLCNEPMGITNLQYKNCCNRIKDSCKKLDITGTSAEPLFLHLFMESLNVNGRCATVVPDGVLFNESSLHHGTRMKLIEEYNLKKVILLNDKDIFLNTNVCTSILYFENNGKTKNTTFSSISLKNDKLVEEIIIDVNYDTLVKNNYSLFINKYKLALEKRISGISYMKLGDICNIEHPKLNSGAIDNNGEFKFYNGCAKSPVGTHSTFNVDYPEYIGLIKGGGAGKNKYGDQIGLGKVFYLNNKNTLSNGLYVIKLKVSNITYKYLYFIMKHMKNNLMDLATYTTGMGNIKQASLKDFELPIPSIEIQNKIVERIEVIETVKSKIKSLENLIIKDQYNILNSMLSDSNNNECVDYCDNIESMICNLEETIIKNNILINSILTINH